MKNILLALILLFTSNLISAQSLNNLLHFKSMSLNKIEENLIIEDWNFKSSKKDKERNLPDIKSSNLLDVYNASISDTYESRIYEYVGYAEDITTIEITVYADTRPNEIKIKSENKLVYQNILNDLLSSNFRLSNEKCPYESYHAGDYKIGEKIIIESNGKVYKKENNKVHLILNRYGIIESINTSTDTFSYEQNKMINEYLIYVE